MLELTRDLLPVLRGGEPVAIVTVVRVARSAPRGVGASMAVTRDGAVIGSISGGCVEGESVALALAVLATGRARTASFGFTDEAAHAAGLACGGSVEVLAYRIEPTDAAALSALEDAADDRAVTVTVDADGTVSRVAGRPDPSTPLGACVVARESRLLPGERPLLVLSAAPRPRLIVVGAGEHAAALCRIAAAAGWRVSVCDVWPLLVTAERFPAAADVVAAMPHEWLASLDPEGLDERTAVCVLTHDERVDVPAIATALALPVGFVGAMGARSTVAHRLSLLRERGLDDVTLARLHSPLGLDLGGATPEESALAVLAEIVASRHGGSGAPLRERTGPLHRRDEASVPAVASCAPAVESCSPAAAGRSR